MKHSLEVGFSFGLTSGIIATLGLMVGLNSGTQSEIAVIGGIITIAIADAFSDSLGIHISEETENHHTTKEIWESTLSTFFAKFIFAMTFVIPVLLFNLKTAIIVSIVWGYLLIGLLSCLVARKRKDYAWKAVFEHLLVLTIVIIVAHYVGVWTSLTFG